MTSDLCTHPQVCTHMHTCNKVLIDAECTPYISVVSHPSMEGTTSMRAGMCLWVSLSHVTT